MFPGPNLKHLISMQKKVQYLLTSVSESSRERTAYLRNGLCMLMKFGLPCIVDEYQSE